MSYLEQALVPNNFEVPEQVEHDQFRLRPLTTKDAITDYLVLINDYKNMADTFSPDPDYSEELSFDLETDIKHVVWHEFEFYIRRSSFVYIIEKNESRRFNYRGCFYIFPAVIQNADAEIYIWVSQVDQHDNLDEQVYHFAQKWIKEVWPFKNPVFPGRSLSWDEYKTREL